MIEKEEINIIRQMERYLESDVASPQDPLENDEDKKPCFTQWGSSNDGTYFPTVKTVDKLPPGLYEIEWSNKISDWIYNKNTFNTDELYELPTPELSEILCDIKKFWEKSEMYKKYKLVHKRGILLYGDPGCGKSGIIQLCMSHIIKNLSGIVINIKNEDSVRGYSESIPKLRQIEPHRPIIVIIEDIDSIVDDNSHVNSLIINMLDGVKQIENVVYIATTNYPEKLAERITNRPSRFDRRYYIPPPSNKIRRLYLEKKCDGLKFDIDQWVKDTEGMSMAHLKELFISVFVLGNEYKDALSHLNGLKEKPRSKNQKSIGFGH
jgi:hypothetical protein